jgi:hypothetical protein
LGLLVGEIDELQAAKAVFGTFETLVFRQHADVINGAAGDTWQKASPPWLMLTSLPVV